MRVKASNAPCSNNQRNAEKVFRKLNRSPLLRHVCNNSVGAIWVFVKILDLSNKRNKRRRSKKGFVETQVSNSPPVEFALVRTLPLRACEHYSRKSNLYACLVAFSLFMVVSGCALTGTGKPRSGGTRYSSFGNKSVLTSKIFDRL